MDDVLVAYLAGLIDCNGSVTLAPPRRTSFRNPVLLFSSADRGLSAALLSYFGGHLQMRAPKQERHSPSYEWRLVDRKALGAMAVLMPHLRSAMKYDRMFWLVQNYDRVTVRNGRYSAAQREAKLEFERGFFEIR